MTSQEPDRHSVGLFALDVRVGNGEREKVARQLALHCAAGRLTVDELDDRVARAWGARTHGDLLPLTSDLPPATAATATTWRSWIQEGRVLASTVPVRLLVLAGGAAALVFILLLTLLVMHHGFADLGPRAGEH